MRPGLRLLILNHFSLIAPSQPPTNDVVLGGGAGRGAAGLNEVALQARRASDLISHKIID